MLTVQERAQYLDRRILKHMAFKASRNSYPTMAGLKRATYCDDGKLLSERLDYLFKNGKLEAAVGAALPPRSGNHRNTATGDANFLNLTAADMKFLHVCGISAD